MEISAVIINIMCRSKPTFLDVLVLERCQMFGRKSNFSGEPSRLLGSSSCPTVRPRKAPHQVFFANLSRFKVFNYLILIPEQNGCF